VEKRLKEILNNFQSGKWQSAAGIGRRFVKCANPKPSPGEVWQYSPEKLQKELSVIIPTYDANRNGYFLKLLSQIDSQDYNDFELIVVRGDPRQGRAINIGAAIANGKYLLTLDDDTSLPDRGTFRKLVDVMEEHPAIGVAGGNSVIPADASPFLQNVMRQIPRRSWEPVEIITDSDLAEHPLLLMRADVFESVGGENELIPRGLDPYLRQQFRKAGYRVVVVPEVTYSHLPPATPTKLIRQFYRNGKQAAFCNRFYPQWVIETPDSHGANFVEKRPFLYRIARYAVNLVRKLLSGHWIYVTVYTVYAFGFVMGLLRYTDKTQT
jgi:glycosyltransferase involved in cell wall biosynthesis